MSIEILDRGACKAAGLMIFNPFPGLNVFSGEGVSAIESVDDTTVRLTLVEPIGSAEFFALQGPRSAQAGESVHVVWETDTTFLLVNGLIDETVLVDVMIFRLVNRGAFSAPAAGPILDGLPAADRAAVHYAHWWGGQMFSSYLGGWGLAGSGVAVPLEYTSLPALLAYEPGTTRVGLETRDQSGAARDCVCAVAPLQGVLVDNTDTPTLDGNGSTLAITMPAGIGFRYTRADILGLAADDSAFSIFWAADPSAFQYGAAFVEGLPANGNWPWAGYASITPPTFADVSCSNSGGTQAEVAWDPLSEPIGKGSWFGFVMPAGGTTADARFYVNGVLQTVRNELTPGPFSLALADSFAWFGYNTALAVDASACILFQREIVGAGLDVVRQFFESLRLP